MRKRRQKNVHPKLAEKICKSVTIPVLPAEIRNTFVRPDILRLYVPKNLKAESEKEELEELNLQRIKEKYREKRIRKVIRKIRNPIGKIRFTVVWENEEEETLNSEYLHSHRDWYLIEEFEHRTAQKPKNNPTEHSESNSGMDFD